jgi:hypothetical protein
MFSKKTHAGYKSRLCVESVIEEHNQCAEDPADGADQTGDGRAFEPEAFQTDHAE